jgi:DNA-binding GntR family transcriptional regulator
MRMAVRVDSLSQAPDADRIVYLSLHERLHGRIAECARCPALSDAIEKTHVLASTWNCVGQLRSTDEVPRKRHEQLVKGLSNGSPDEAASVMRDHIVGSMERTIGRLESYFALGKKQGARYVRSRRTPPVLSEAGRTSANMPAAEELAS